MVNDSGKPLQDQAGRPPHPSALDKAQFIERVNDGSGNGYAMNVSKAGEVYDGLVTERKKKRKLDEPVDSKISKLSEAIP